MFFFEILLLEFEEEGFVGCLCDCCLEMIVVVECFGVLCVFGELEGSEVYDVLYVML